MVAADAAFFVSLRHSTLSFIFTHFVLFLFKYFIVCNIFYYICYKYNFFWFTSFLNNMYSISVFMLVTVSYDILGPVYINLLCMCQNLCMYDVLDTWL